MISSQALESTSPMASVVEVRPKDWSRTPPTTTSSDLSVVLIVMPESSVYLLPLVQGTMPLAPSLVIKDEPADLGDEMDFTNPWEPKGAVSFVAERMEWPSPELEY